MVEKVACSLELKTYSYFFCYYSLTFRNASASSLSGLGTEIKMNESGFELWLCLGFCMPGFSQLLHPIMPDKGSIRHLLLAPTVVSFI